MLSPSTINIKNKRCSGTIPLTIRAVLKHMSLTIVWHSRQKLCAGQSGGNKSATCWRGSKTHAFMSDMWTRHTEKTTTYYFEAELDWYAVVFCGMFSVVCGAGLVGCVFSGVLWLVCVVFCIFWCHVVVGVYVFVVCGICGVFRYVVVFCDVCLRFVFDVFRDNFENRQNAHNTRNNALRITHKTRHKAHAQQCTQITTNNRHTTPNIPHTHDEIPRARLVVVWILAHANAAREAALWSDAARRDK